MSTDTDTLTFDQIRKRNRIYATVFGGIAAGAGFMGGLAIPASLILGLSVGSGILRYKNTENLSYIKGQQSWQDFASGFLTAAFVSSAAALLITAGFNMRARGDATRLVERALLKWHQCALPGGSPVIVDPCGPTISGATCTATIESNERFVPEIKSTPPTRRRSTGLYTTPQFLPPNLPPVSGEAFRTTVEVNVEGPAFVFGRKSEWGFTTEVDVLRPLHLEKKRPECMAQVNPSNS